MQCISKGRTISKGLNASPVPTCALVHVPVPRGSSLGKESCVMLLSRSIYCPEAIVLQGTKVGGSHLHEEPFADEEIIQSQEKLAVMVV
jgi:hypothetical protein